MCLKESFGTVHIGYLFHEFSPFLEEFNGKIGEMISAGLTQYWIHEKANPRGRKPRAAENIGPQVLTMEDLAAAFIACLIPLFVSLAAFIFEVGVLWRRKIVEQITFVYIVRALFKP